MFRSASPSLLVVEDFYDDPDAIRKQALGAIYKQDAGVYKGYRSTEQFLWPYLREEFCRLLNREVVGWLDYPMNGRFQMTDSQDPLVWHSDMQQYAAAVYLNPDNEISGGTSFWRDREQGFRKFPAGLEIPEGRFTNPEGWELVESVAGLYNRLVIWDAQLIHSATSYDQFEGVPRLVHLFFFDVA